MPSVYQAATKVGEVGEGGAIGRSSDLVLWATGAQAHDWQREPLRRGALAVNEEGFVRVDAQLRSVSHPQVFAVGDCAHWDPGAHALPKAGVVAVRMGPVLSDNLRAACSAGIEGSTGVASGTGIASGSDAILRTYLPQQQFLVLLATADGRAVASRGSLGAAGAWAWHWKDYIDRRFIARYAMPSAAASITAFKKDIA